MRPLGETQQLHRERDGDGGGLERAGQPAKTTKINASKLTSTGAAVVVG